MTRIGRLPTQALAIGLFAITGLAAANPMAEFIDCTDSFWAVACAPEGEAEPVVIPGELVRIDNDPVCMAIEGGLTVCHT